MIGVLVSLLAVVGVFVLPGFGLSVLLRWATGRRFVGNPAIPDPDRPLEALILALAWSVLVLSAFGAVLIGLGVFSYGILGAAVGALALIGLPRFGVVVGRLRREWGAVAVLLLLSIPFLATALRANLTPTHSYQWYYWDLGRQLDIAHGVPSSVLEFGLAERWHPDYVLAVIGTSAYRALTFPLAEATAISVYRVPIFLMALSATYVVFRLWLERVPALIGVGAASATTLYVTKFASYKPETIALAVGLFATWLLITSIRRRVRSMTLLSGALFGVAVGMHGIAAAVTGMFAVVAAASEIWSLAPTYRRAVIGNAVRAAVLAAIIVVATGLGLQGRAVVATDAGHPVLEHGQDPTWAFLNRHNGTFYLPPQPTIGDQAEDTLEHPWPGGLVGEWGWLVASVIVLAAALLAVRMGGRRRTAAASLLGTAGLISLAMLFFGVKFDTFIPQHTGLTRIAIYLGLLYGLGIGIAAELLWERAQASIFDRFHLMAAGAAAVVFVGAWAVGVGMGALDNYGGIGPGGREALKFLEREAAGPDEAVLSNISTRGLIEFTTRMEAPLEGRQPVIEDPQFLQEANTALIRIHHYFEHPTSPALLRRLGVRWLLVSDGARGFGSPFNLGLPSGQIERLQQQAYLETVWRDGSLAVLRMKDSIRPLDSVGPRKDLAVNVLISLLVIAGAAWALSSARRREAT